VNFKTIAACACFLIASGMRKAAYLEGRGMHVTKAYLKTHSRDDATRYSFEKRLLVDKSANLASLLLRYTSHNGNVDLRESLLILLQRICSFQTTFPQ